MIYHVVHTMLTKATITDASLDSGRLSVGEFSAGLLFADVGAVKTNTTLDITVETSPDGGTNWHELTTMTQITDADASSQVDVKALTDMGEDLRVSCAIAGVVSPSINFGIKFVGKGEG